jgi:hypothetical protein
MQHMVLKAPLVQIQLRSIPAQLVSGDGAADFVFTRALCVDCDEMEMEIDVLWWKSHG